jgi:hypothetical protein
MRDAPRKKQAESSVPDWWQQQARVDAAGVARRSESWWMRSRFAIACVVACLALMAAIVMGTMKRLPVGGGTTGERLPAAVAATSHARSDGAARSATGANHHAPKKGQADRRSHGNSGSGRRQEE